MYGAVNDGWDPRPVWERSTRSLRANAAAAAASQNSSASSNSTCAWSGGSAGRDPLPTRQTGL